MNNLSKKVIKTFCGSSATCQKFIERNWKNFGPEVIAGKKCICNKKERIN